MGSGTVSEGVAADAGPLDCAPLALQEAPPGPIGDKQME